MKFKNNKPNELHKKSKKNKLQINNTNNSLSSNKVNEESISCTSTTIKLSKQERRNRNKLIKLSTTANNLIVNNNLKNKISSQITSNTTNISVYKRPTEYPNTIQNYFGPWNRFITPKDNDFTNILQQCYQGFHVSPSNEFKTSFHTSFMNALEGLEKEGYFQYDITQPAGLGTKTAKTFVTRCLVGDAGITYKYLGLRMFSIPWNNNDDDDNSNNSNNNNSNTSNNKTSSKYNSSNSNSSDNKTSSKYISSENAKQIGLLNNEMIRHTDKLLKGLNKKQIGSCQYNLTLINRCFPQQDVNNLKFEPTFENEKCAVSWHADSTLEHFSSIGVYQYIKSTPTTNTTTFTTNSNDESWKVALRVWFDAEGPNASKAISSRACEMQKKDIQIAPYLAIPLPSNASYFLLDDFNHHHQHAVLAGNTHRYGSTHRVCKTEGHTFQSIYQRSLKLLTITTTCSSNLQYSAKHIRSLLLMMIEIEFEWIRQFYIQGKRHWELHIWWRTPIQELLRIWNELNKRLSNSIIMLGIFTFYDKSINNDNNTNSNGYDDDNNNNIKENNRKLRKKHLKLMHKMECIDIDSFDAMIELLDEYHQKRIGWMEREKDAIYKTLSPEYRPLQVPIDENSTIQLIIKEQETSPIIIPSTINNINNNINNNHSIKNIATFLDIVSILNEWKNHIIN